LEHRREIGVIRAVEMDGALYIGEGRINYSALVFSCFD
jgi:hypothetical protein